MPTPIPASYPAQYERRLKLKNGQEVFLRPILPTDGPLLVELFNRMSPQARYERFLRPLKALPDKLLDQFTHLNYHSDFALAGVIQEAEQETIIAVGRYAREPQDAGTDFAVAVRDDWQQVGLGKALLATLFAIGKDQGISRFQSVVDAQNAPMRKLLAGLGYEVRYRVRSGFLDVEISV